MSENKQLTKENVKEFFNGVEFKYFIAFVKEPENEILHIVGFLEPPLVADVTNTIEEVRNDKEFGIGDLVDILRLKIFSFTD